jgi:putative spermidine/putrescine transport system ATP-binding protein
MSVVELKNVTKSYGAEPVVSIDLLRVEDGEFVALLGPSGCGKTTVLHMIAGFAEPTTGEILIDSKSMGLIPAHKRNIGVVFQSYALFPHLSVFGNVAFGLKMRNVGKAEITTRVMRVLDLVRLAGLDQRFPKELSGGQQQRVAIARALVIEPSVLLLDEPLSNLDANLRDQMRFEIREIQKRIGITTIFVTHDQQEAMAAADRLVIMSKGEIKQIGTPRQIYENPVDRFVATFIGQANLFSGVIEQVKGDKAFFKLDEGELVIAPMRPGFLQGVRAVLAVRPGSLEVAEHEQSGANNIAATVINSTYLGNTSQVTLRVGNKVITATTTASMPSKNRPIFLIWPVEAGVLLPD